MRSDPSTSRTSCQALYWHLHRVSFPSRSANGAELRHRPGLQKSPLSIQPQPLMSAGLAEISTNDAVCLNGEVKISQRFPTFSWLHGSTRGECLQLLWLQHHGDGQVATKVGHYCCIGRERSAEGQDECSGGSSADLVHHLDELAALQSCGYLKPLQPHPFQEG